LYFIKLYSIIIPATCSGLIFRAIFRLIFRELECTINSDCTLKLSKDQPEDVPTNWVETCRWNFNVT